MELLARVGRFDEAHAVLRYPAWNGKPPALLRGRAAWVEALRGNVAKAVRRMKSVLADDPNYYGGWRWLADWHSHLGNHRGYLRAAERMVQLAPGDPTAYGYLGEAHLNNGDRKEAMQAFGKAQALDADYLFAGVNLFDLALEDKDLSAAEGALAAMQKRHGNDVAVAVREIRLHAAAARPSAALAAFRRFCTAAAHEQVAALLTEMETVGWGDDARQSLQQALITGDAPPQLAKTWLQASLAAGSKRCAADVDFLLEQGEAGLHAAAALADALGERKAVASLRSFVKEREQLLRSSTWCWACIGAAFGKAGDYATAVRWLGDYQQHDDAEPQMLLHHALYLRELGRPEDARRVHAHALQLAAQDHTIPSHRLWLVLDAALAGKTDLALKGLKAIEPATLDSYHLYLRQLVEAVLDVQSAEEHERPQAFAQARKKLKAAARRPLLDQGDALLPTYRRIVRRLAADAGGFRARLWAMFRCRYPSVPKHQEVS